MGWYTVGFGLVTSKTKTTCQALQVLTTCLITELLKNLLRNFLILLW